MKMKYELEPIIRKKDVIEVIIEGDCNDGDYNTTIEEYDITELQNQDFLKALHGLASIKDPREDMAKQLAEKLKIDLDEAYDIEDFINDRFDIPSDDWGVCHTITSLYASVKKAEGTEYILHVSECE